MARQPWLLAELGRICSFIFEVPSALQQSIVVVDSRRVSFELQCKRQLSALAAKRSLFASIEIDVELGVHRISDSYPALNESFLCHTVSRSTYVSTILMEKQ